MSSLREGAATVAASAIALALPLKSWLFAVEETSAGLANSDCWAGSLADTLAGILAAARCAIALADRASDFILATPAAVLDASVGPAASGDADGGAAAAGPRASGRVSTTVGVLVGEGFANAPPGCGVAPRRLPPDDGAAPTPYEPAACGRSSTTVRIDATGAALPAPAPSVRDALGSGPGSGNACIMSRADGGRFSTSLSSARITTSAVFMETSGLRSRSGGKLNGGSSCGSRPLSR